MKSTIRVCVVYSRDLAGMPMVTHESVNIREPQPGSKYPQTAKTAINGRRVKPLKKKVSCTMLNSLFFVADDFIPSHQHFQTLLSFHIQKFDGIQSLNKQYSTHNTQKYLTCFDKL